MAEQIIARAAERASSASPQSSIRSKARRSMDAGRLGWRRCTTRSRCSADAAAGSTWSTGRALRRDQLQRQRLRAESVADVEEVVVARAVLPQAGALLGQRRQRGRLGVVPLQGPALLVGCVARDLADVGEVAEVLGARAGDLLGPLLTLPVDLHDDEAERGEEEHAGGEEAAGAVGAAAHRRDEHDRAEAAEHRDGVHQDAAGALALLELRRRLQDDLTAGHLRLVEPLPASQCSAHASPSRSPDPDALMIGVLRATATTLPRGARRGGHTRIMPVRRRHVREAVYECPTSGSPAATIAISVHGAGRRPRPGGAHRRDAGRRRPGVRRTRRACPGSRCSRPPSASCCTPTARSPSRASSPAPCWSRPPASTAPGREDTAPSTSAPSTPQAAALSSMAHRGRRAAGLAAWYAALSGDDWLRTVTVGVLMACALVATLPAGSARPPAGRRRPGLRCRGRLRRVLRAGRPPAAAVVVGAAASRPPSSPAIGARAGRRGATRSCTVWIVVGLPGLRCAARSARSWSGTTASRGRSSLLLAMLGRALRAVARHRRTRRGAPRPRPARRDRLVGARHQSSGRRGRIVVPGRGDAPAGRRATRTVTAARRGDPGGHPASRPRCCSLSATIDLDRIGARCLAFFAGLSLLLAARSYRHAGGARAAARGRAGVLASGRRLRGRPGRSPRRTPSAWSSSGCWARSASRPPWPPVGAGARSGGRAGPRSPSRCAAASPSPRRSSRPASSAACGK